MFYRRDRIYARRELAFRFVAGSLIFILYFGVRTHEWRVLLWVWLTYALVWVAVLLWLRSRGQIGSTYGADAD